MWVGSSYSALGLGLLPLLELSRPGELRYFRSLRSPLAPLAPPKPGVTQACSPFRPGSANLSASVPCFTSSLPRLWVKGARTPRNRRTEKMKVEQAKQIASNAIEQLKQALEAGHSEGLKQYLTEIGRASCRERV